MTRRATLLLTIALAAAPAGAAALKDWRQLVTIQDGRHLSEWHAAWTAALRDARAGNGAATIAADPLLFDPDRALAERASPAAGDYRCRRFDLGARPGAPSLAVEEWGRCRVGDGEDGHRQLTGLDGVQRLFGTIYADTDRRAVFLGTTVFPEERRPAAYGHAAGRDVAGVVERVGEARWRLVLPYPPFGAAVSLVEISAAR